MSKRPAKRPKPTRAGRRRVEEAFAARGLLVVSGQLEVPSIADLLADAPVTTRGYSWDYVPAWEVRWELEQRADVANLKLFRGRSTLVAKRHWPAVDALARAARAGVLAGHGKPDRRRLLDEVEANPGSSGDQLKLALGWTGKDGTRAFQRAKNDLAQWLCVWGEDREGDDGEHTHDQAWLPWSEGKPARALRRRKTRPALDDAVGSLLEAVFPEGSPARAPRATSLFPALRPARSSAP